MVNPYTPPDPDGLVAEPVTVAKARIARPATALVIMSSIHSVLLAIPIVSWCVVAARGSVVPRDNLGEFIIALVQFVVLIVICIGAARMGHLKSRRQGWVASVLSCIPGLSPFIFIGIPFGIWAILLLSDDDVRSAFPESNA